MHRICIIFVAFAVSACVPKPPPVTTLINCPQPPVEATQPAEPLPEIPTPQPDAEDAIRVYARAIAETDGLYEIETGRRRSLVQWGRTHCGWN